jgi:hypothetical protein
VQCPSTHDSAKLITVEASTSEPHRKENTMHDFLLAAAFLMMVILPCIVTMGSGSSEEEGDEA